MSEILSQDQIDALLSQGSGSQGSGAGSIDIGDSDGGAGLMSAGKNYDVLKEICSLLCDQAANVLTTVLSKKIVLECQQCAATDSSVVAGAPPSTTLVSVLEFKGAVSGKIFAVLAKKDVAMLSDLMMMGDGKAEYTDDHKDAISELFNQIMGSFCTALSDKCSDTISLAGVSTLEFDPASAPFAMDASDMGITDLTVEDFAPTQMHLFFPSDVSDSLLAKFKSSSSSGSGGGDLSSDGISLSMGEANDLSQITADFGSSSFDDNNFKSRPSSSGGSKENIDMLMDIELDVSIELGKTMLSIKRILELAPGAVIELDRLAGEPVDLLVNNKVVAKGEVVVVDESFGIRIVSLVSPEERIKSLH